MTVDTHMFMSHMDLPQCISLGSAASETTVLLSSGKASPLGARICRTWAVYVDMENWINL